MIGIRLLYFPPLFTQSPPVYGVYPLHSKSVPSFLNVCATLRFDIPISIEDFVWLLASIENAVVEVSRLAMSTLQFALIFAHDRGGPRMYNILFCLFTQFTRVGMLNLGLSLNKATVRMNLVLKAEALVSGDCTFAGRWSNYYV